MVVGVKVNWSYDRCPAEWRSGAREHGQPLTVRIVINRRQHRRFEGHTMINQARKEKTISKTGHATFIPRIYRIFDGLQGLVNPLWAKILRY